MRVKLPGSALARAGIGVACVVVLAAAGIAAGLVFSPGEGGPQPGPGDHYAAPPNCDLVSSVLPEDVLPEGVLDLDALRPLGEGSARNCTWTTADAPDAVPRWLQVDAEVYFGTEEHDGAELAARRMEELRGEQARDRDDLGAQGLVRPEGEQAAEAVFLRNNLLVRVVYGGAAAEEPLDASEAEQTAADVAEALHEAV